MMQSEVRVLLRERWVPFAERLLRGDRVTSGADSVLGGCREPPLSELSLPLSSWVVDVSPDLGAFCPSWERCLPLPSPFSLGTRFWKER